MGKDEKERNRKEGDFFPGSQKRSNSHLLMKREYFYIKAHPLVEAFLIGPKEKIKVIALIDSGADYSLFDWEIGKKLGIEIEKGERVIFSGVSGPPILGYLHQLPIELGEKTFKCKIVFAKVRRIALFGRNNFFDPFLITFNERNKKFLIEENL